MNRKQSILAAGTLTMLVLVCVLLFGLISQGSVISSVLAQPQVQVPSLVEFTSFEEGDDEYENDDNWEEEEYEEHDEHEEDDD